MASLQQQRCDGCGATSKPWIIDRQYGGELPAGWHTFDVTPLGGGQAVVDICADCWDSKPCSDVLPVRREP